MWKYPAVVLSWYDGDTAVCDIRATPVLEFHAVHVRLEGMNAPELRAAGGADARAYAIKLAPPGTPIQLESTRPEKYGRFLASMHLPSGLDLSAEMIAAGHAVPYDGS